VVLCSCALAGRIAGLSVTALWTAGTAYFLMAPTYSFRVSNSRDLAALALYGTAGLVIARIRPVTRRVQELRDVPAIEFSPDILVDFRKVLIDLTSSSELGQRLKEQRIEIEASLLDSFRCSYIDAVRILSQVFAAVLTEPQLLRISFHAGRRPGVELLFVTAHRVWPLPFQRTITIGRSDEDCKCSVSWLPNLGVTSFDNGYGRDYQIRLDHS